MQEQEKQEPPEDLDKRIRLWRVCLTWLVASLIGIYIVYFAVVLGQNPAKDADKWGQFGDFFGGILNPLVAFAAFYWLTQSVKLQKKELTETRKALEKAAEAQREQAVLSAQNLALAISTQQTQVKAAKQTAMLSAISAKLRSIHTRIASIQEAVVKYDFEIQRTNKAHVINTYQKEKNEALDVLKGLKVERDIWDKKLLEIWKQVTADQASDVPQ